MQMLKVVLRYGEPIPKSYDECWSKITEIKEMAEAAKMGLTAARQGAARRRVRRQDPGVQGGLRLGHAPDKDAPQRIP
jgi:hypothetical protein